ncbi:S-layer homology domain-containing protein [Cohnella fermenti]|uniref:DUF4832 domain-containing protein n=1 Tax=Cohnella fermenti TaxID=2565925 RepID=A0A4S4BZ02_9BACL|nr:S-layer homology domain-containing protein [Cohnella fermenti]THF79962.1 DUF4832 domain-containing protein [Cohnella fermenti]
MLRRRGKRWVVCCLLAGSLLLGIACPPFGPVEAAPSADDSFGGTPGEWQEIESDSVGVGNMLQQLKALQQDGKLYLYVGGDGLAEGGTFFIDSDNNPLTGSASGLWSDSAGIDYELRGAELFRYDQSGWTSVGPAAVRTEETFLEAEIDLASLEVVGSHNVKVGFERDGIHALPETSGLMLSVAPPAAYVDDALSIEVDGDSSDWASINELAHSADGSTTLRAFSSGNRLNVLIEGQIDSGEFPDLWEHMLIDVDRNPATGSSSWAWANTLGSEYLVQYGLLYESGADGGWTWNDTSTTFPYARSGTGNHKAIEWSLPLEDLGITETTSINIGFLSNTLTAPAATADPATLTVRVSPRITVDGDASDWASIDTLAQTTDGTTTVKAFAADGRLNVLIAGQIDANEFADGLWEHVLIDADKNPATGSSSWAWANTLGSDYLVQFGGLFRSGEDGGWAWSDLGVSFPYVRAGTGANKTIEWSLPLEELGLEEASSIRLGFLSNIAAAPDAAGDPATLTLGMGSIPIVIDGQDDDWNSVELGASPSGVLTELQAVQDSRKLYTLVTGTNLDLRNVYYLDSDNDGTTGYASPDWQDAGADYKVDRGTLYRYSEPEQEWTEAGSVYSNVTSETAEMYLYWDQIGRTGPGEIRIGYESRSILQLPNRGEPMMASARTVSAPDAPNTYYPRESFDVLENPFMGWVPWAKDKDKPAGEAYSQPHSLVYAGISWRELEPERGVFDWEGIEEKYQFDFWSSQGKRINIRIVLDTPTEDPAHLDIPDWLYDELSEEGIPGTWYDTTEIGAGFSPNYDSPTLLAEHGRMLEAVAARYNEDPRIGFVQLGSLGHWGEWHTWPSGSGAFPLLSVSDSYVRQYMEAFPDKKIGMRKPFPIASEYKLGLFNDVFGIKSSTNEWIGWTKNGWSGIGEFVDPGDNPNEKLEASKMPDFWQNSFSGGEFAEGNPQKWLTDDAIMESLRQVRDSHTSWLGPSAPASVPTDSPLQPNLDAMMKIMGYRYVIEAVTHPSAVKRGTALPVSFVLNNKGVAPFYYDWPLELSLADAQGQVVYSTTEEGTDIRDWLPGKTTVNAVMSVPSTLNAGTYTLQVSLLDPSTGQPGIRLANDGVTAEGRYALDQVTVTADGGTNIDVGSHPGANTGNSTPNSASVPEIAAEPVREVGTDGAERTAYKVDELAMKKAIDAIGLAGEPQTNAVLRLLLPVRLGEAEEAHAVLSGSALRAAALAMPTGAISIEADGAGFLLPVNLLNLDSLAKQLGVSVEQVAIRVSISMAAGTIAERAKKDAEKGGMEPVGEPIAFEVAAEAGGKRIVLSEFGNVYVQRTIKLAGVRDTDGLTALRYDPDTGAFSFVPARFVAGDEFTQAALKRNGNSLYMVVRLSKTFADLDGHWAKNAIDRLASKGLLNGTAADRFEADKALTRAQFASMLARALGLTPQLDAATAFADVKDDAWYAGEVGAATMAGFVHGTGNASFEPEAGITREQAAVLLASALNYIAPGTSAAVDVDDILLKLGDESSISGWARDAVAVAMERGLMKGTGGGIFDPKRIVTRAEAAVVAERFLVNAGLID